MRIAPAEFLALDLEAHALLREVPLRDVSVVDLLRFELWADLRYSFLSVPARSCKPGGPRRPRTS